MRDTPYPVFWVTTRFFHVIDRLASLKPAPFRVPEIAAAYVQSQVCMCACCVCMQCCETRAALAMQCTSP